MSKLPLGTKVKIKAADPLYGGSVGTVTGDYRANQHLHEVTLSRLVWRGEDVGHAAGRSLALYLDDIELAA